MKKTDPATRRGKFQFSSVLWKYSGPAGWHFVTLPKDLSKKIRNRHGSSEEGWGRLKVLAKIDDHQWQTAIWFDSKADAYILPIKAVVRKKTQLQEGSKVKVEVKALD